MRTTTVNTIFKISQVSKAQTQEPSQLENANFQGAEENVTQFGAAKKGENGNEAPEPQKPLVNKDKNIGRNDPCPCGAKKEDGTPKKYKNCCGKNA